MGVWYNYSSDILCEYLCIYWAISNKKLQSKQANDMFEVIQQQCLHDIIWPTVCTVCLSQNNIEPCPECGHLKQKHVLCGFCYAKVCRETSLIRHQIKEMEGGPLRALAVETVVLYEGETQSEQDKDKRIVERARKRPAWFSQWSYNGLVITAVRRDILSVWRRSGQIHTCYIISRIFYYNLIHKVICLFMLDQHWYQEPW